jgi:hypothetical protein
MKVRYTAPTEAFPFFTNVKVETKSGVKSLAAYPEDGRPKGPAIFASKDEMIEGVRKAVAGA